MRRYFLIISIFVISLFGIGFWYAKVNHASEVRFSDVEAEFEDPTAEISLVESVIATTSDTTVIPTLNTDFSTLSPTQRRSRWASYWKEFSPEEQKIYGNWKRGDGPLHVGIQVGHWKNDQVPDELSGLKRSGGGATGGGKIEVDTVLIIAREVKALLEAKGIVVDLLPATIPVDYVADAFVSIHADGNNNPSVSGFKIASPQRDFSRLGAALVSELYESYGKQTGLNRDDNVTRRMSGYYAFNWRRYDHAVFPMTPSAIVETGFMTSPKDRAVIVSDPERAAKGIADGILNFLSIK